MLDPADLIASSPDIIYKWTDPRLNKDLEWSISYYQ